MAFANPTTAGPMADLNTTPLIDVMLVLLVMFIITIPVATHEVPVDLPTDRTTPVVPNELKNKVTITQADKIMWNGETVTEGQLVAVLAASLRLPVEPELQFEPEAAASYDTSARVLHLIKRSGATKFGFVGNHNYRTFARAE